MSYFLNQIGFHHFHQQCSSINLEIHGYICEINNHELIMNLKCTILFFTVFFLTFMHFDNFLSRSKGQELLRQGAHLNNGIMSKKFFCKPIYVCIPNDMSLRCSTCPLVFGCSKLSDFSQVEKERTACKAKQIRKIATISTQNGPKLSFCEFALLCKQFFLSQFLKIT